MENNEKTTVEQPVESSTETAVAKKGKSADTKKSAFSVLEKVGKTIIRERGYAEVFVTADGQAFRLESDAKNHARNLKDREVLKVKK